VRGHPRHEECVWVVESEGPRDTPDTKNATPVLRVWVVKGQGRVEGRAGRVGVPPKVGGDWPWRAPAGFLTCLAAVSCWRLS